MKKLMIIWALFVLLMCSCSSINSKKDLERVEKVNTLTLCPGITSQYENTSRKAVRRCRNGDVLKATLYYHPDFGTRLEVAKVCKNTEMLKKARVFAKNAKPKGEEQEELHGKLLRTLNKKLRKVNKISSTDDLALANAFEEKSFSAKEVVQMEDFQELVDIFLYYSDFKLKLLALERVYAILTDTQDMSYKKASAKVKTAKWDIRTIIKRFFPVFLKLNASGERQERYKKTFLTELQSIFDTIDPRPGQEAYVDKGTFLRKVNALRYENGLKPIKYDEQLNAAALEWAKYHHDNQLPDLKREHGESSFSDKIADESYNCRSSVANLSRLLIPNAENLFTEWDDSPEEKDNMLNGDFKKMGLACVYTPLKKRKDKYICVQLLADADGE